MDKRTNDNTVATENMDSILEIDLFPFKGMQISENWRLLESVEGRTTCSLCNKSRKYFCYSCYVAVSEIKSFLPKLKLPVKIDIIKHAREMDGKSTAVHAAVLAPEDIRIFTYPCIPDYSPQENVVLIFPNKDAVSVEEVCARFLSKIDEPLIKRQCRESDGFVVHRAVFIDSTWNQSRGIFKDPRIKGLPSIVLKSRLSQFWRHQADSPRWYLATIEAIHQFLLELDAVQWKINCTKATSEDITRGTGSENTPVMDKAKNSDNTSDSRNSKEISPSNDSEARVESNSANTKTVCNEKTICDENVSCKGKEYVYSGQYDNLLFFFRFMYSKIHTLYDHERLKSYKRRLE